MNVSTLLKVSNSLLPLCGVVAQQHPHIILIMADQHRFDALGCIGNQAIYTPNIDSLAFDGTLFINAYSSTPSSTPARSGLLTGMSPWHHGMLGYGRISKKYKYEMPRMLRELGYYTFGIGKMHWYPQHTLHGFHATLVDESGRVESPDFISDYRLWFQLQMPGENPDKTGIGWNDLDGGIYCLPEHLHPTAWTGKTACELIENYKDEQPLFLKVSFARPHSPYDPPQRFLDMYDKDIPAPYIGNWCRENATLQEPNKETMKHPYGNYGEKYAKNVRRHYYANITFVDEEIGKIIKTLKKRGMYNQSLIVYLSDHGDMLGDHYHWLKTYPYEGSSHIPFIVKWPSSFAILPGIKRHEVVELRDVLPTFLDAAGGKVPLDIDVLSIVRLMKDKKAQWRRFIDLEHATCYTPENYWCALTDGKIKYIWNFYNGKEQLFDLINDPNEKKEVSSVSSYKSVLHLMKQALIRHLQERGSEFVKDDKIVIRRNRTLLYSPHYPK